MGTNNIFVGGCDIGSTTGKAVIMREETIISYSIIVSTTKPELTAQSAMDEAMKKAGLFKQEDMKYIVGTGYGRLKVTFANENVSEITCHARGANWLCPSVRTVVDIGGQDCKVISMDKNGKVLDFVMNDKCAAGTGRFFEAMARALHCDLDGLSALSLKAIKPSVISSQCSVFAESEVVTLINEGIGPENIAAGIHNSIAGRLSSMVRKVGISGDISLTGGCAKNQGLVKALEEKLGVKVIKLTTDPQIVGAIGAALIARQRLD